MIFYSSLRRPEKLSEQVCSCGNDRRLVYHMVGVSRNRRTDATYRTNEVLITRLCRYIFFPELKKNVYAL